MNPIQRDTVTMIDLTDLEQACLLREAADVKRFHTVRTMRQQSVGAHTFNALLLLTMLFPTCRKEVMIALMHHDLPELITGDIPGPTKWNNPAISVYFDEFEKTTAPLYNQPDLTVEEERMVFWCDKMEGVLFSMEEIMMGNTYMIAPFRRWTKLLSSTPSPNEACRNLLMGCLKRVNLPDNDKHDPYQPQPRRQS